MAVDIIARAMAANASSGGGSSSDFPIIDATGDTEVDLDNYLEEGTWFIKGNNIKQMKNTNYEFVKTAPSAILTIRTVNGAAYQSLEFPNLAYSTSTGYYISNYIGARKIKPSIDERFQIFSMPTRITDNYTSGIFNDATSYAFSQSGANTLYTEIIEAIGKFGTSYGLAKLTNLKTTDKHSLVNAINELVDTKQDKLTAGSGIKIEDNVISALGGSGAFPIIDATGETEIDLDNYLDDGTWIIKGHNVKQIKEYRYAPATETDWAILEIKTQNWLSNGYVYQILQFPIMAYNNGGLQKQLHYGIRQIKPSIESMFKDSIIPISVTDYYDIFPDDGYQKVLSAMGSYNMYTALMSYLTNNINNEPRLTNLTTTDKTSLVNAINEVNTKISSGTFATNLTEVQGYDATKTQVLKNINGQFTWVDES